MAYTYLLAGVLLQGPIADRPAASAGRYWYLATDVDGGTLYHSDGVATWTQMAAGVLATGGGSVSDITSADASLVVTNPSGPTVDLSIYGTPGSGTSLDLTTTGAGGSGYGVHVHETDAGGAGILLESDAGNFTAAVATGESASLTSGANSGVGVQAGFGAFANLQAGETFTVYDHLGAPILQMTEGSPDLHIPTGGAVIADL